jgi:hypothetical protein
VILVVVAIEGTSRIVALEAAATTAVPYANFIAQVRTYIPPGSRVIGLPNYWLGLDDLDYRTWVVPFSQSDPTYRPRSLLVDEALDDLAPDVILIDSRFRTYLDNAPATDPIPHAVRAWMNRRGFMQIAVVEDPTYGTMEIFRVAR